MMKFSTALRIFNPQRSRNGSSVQSTAKYKAHRRDMWADTWLWEMLSLALSAACFIALSTVLLVYDGKSVPRLYWGITLNAIISTLVTISKSALLAAITPALGQLKWHWFQDSYSASRQVDKAGGGGGRSLMDAQLFDDASRGPLGSLRLLIRYRSSLIVSIGAALMVFSVVIDPFAQQLIHYSTLTVPFTNGLAPNVSRSEGIKDWDSGAFNFSLQRSLLRAVWDSSDQLFIPEATCPTANCTWEPFDTLSFCSYCEDQTQNLNQEGCSISFDHNDWNNFVHAYEESHNITDFYNGSQYRATQNDNYHFEELQVNRSCSMKFGGFGLERFNHSENIAMQTNYYSDWVDGKPQDGIQPTELYYPIELIWPLEDDKSGFLWTTTGQDSNSTPPCDKYMGVAEGLSPSAFMRFGSARLVSDENTRPATARDASDTETRTNLVVQEAHVCSLNPCVKRLSVSVNQGAITSRENRTMHGYFSPNTTDTCTNRDQFTGLDDCVTPTSWSSLNCTGRRLWELATLWALEPIWQNGMPPSPNSALTWGGGIPVPANISFVLPSVVLENIATEIRKILPGSIQADDLYFDYNYTLNGTVDGSVLIPTLPEADRSHNEVMSSQIFQQISQKGGLPWVMSRMADSLTALLQEQGSDVVTGVAFNIETYVTVQWPWLAPPALIIFSGVIFVAMTIHRDRGYNRVLWKSSVLPYMYHGMEKQDLSSNTSLIGMKTIDNIGIMEKMAKDTTVGLYRDHVDGELKLTRI